MIGPDFATVFTPSAPGKPVVLALHGTGGDEHSFTGLLQDVLPGFGVFGIRGQVKEKGANRYFARFAEGVLDYEDLAFRTQQLGEFLTKRSELADGEVFALGYSNGANMAANLMLTGAFPIARAVLLRPMALPSEARDLDLAGTRVLILAGAHDEICPPSQAGELARALERQGATVELQVVPSGHNLIRADIVALQSFFS